MYSIYVLALFVGFVRSFSWDIVEGGDKQLQFYYNGTLTHTENITSATKITSVTYDPFQYSVYFVDYKDSDMSIYSFDLTTKTIQPLVTRKAGLYATEKIVYDPLTSKLFWKNERGIYSYARNLASPNEADGNLLITLDHDCRDIAVDTCGRYIYWITDSEIERARLDGAEREVLISDNSVFSRLSLVIDQQTQKMYWSEKTSVNNVFNLSIESANFDGKNRETLYKFSDETFANSLAVSKDFIYWKNDQKETWQLEKNSPKSVERKLYSIPSSNCESCQFISANYPLDEQTQDIKSCEDVHNWISVYLTNICHNYCLQGNCSVTEGFPKCSCRAGYSGERCEQDVCYKHCLNNGVCSLNEEGEPVCFCKAGYEGPRCAVSTSKNICFKTACTINAEGKPKVTVTLNKPMKYVCARNSTATTAGP
ncbi:hypothetical protein PYW07_010733 [Mythimna separata]|uniref:Protein cueball n=1 Tax=Mythimna separata TaxID=271217 RepID=A0AAD7Y7X0_MYTSE|nr:hypothetical protein PYW07_010733 [Mythimna separata]